jgi:conjugative relaxase-like TrwC/TraI family protein
MRMMGTRSVGYHERNVRDRADDAAGAALAYYGSRGETPLVWGGSGAEHLGLSGEVSEAAYRAVFGPGGVRDPETGTRLVSAVRPGMELVVSPAKSIAELGVIGRADDMNAIVDAERDATLGYLDRVVCERGGRRGRAQTPTATGGLTWATTRHATTRAGDPQVHDHVLIANIVRMGDERGGWKAADTAFVREQLHAATAVGRLAAARKAVELGYGIEADPGPSGRLGGFRISGVPAEVCEVHSKRAAQINEAAGVEASYRERNMAARVTRDRKQREPVTELVGRWQAELASAGWSIEDLARSVELAGLERDSLREHLANDTARELVDWLLGPEGPLAEAKVLSRADLVVAAAPHLHGLPPAELDGLVDRVIADSRCIPLLGVEGARERVWAPACVLVREQHIARLAERLAGQHVPRLTPADAAAALSAVERAAGFALNAGQAATAAGVLCSGRGLELIVGVAGSGKTTCLAAVRAGFEAHGFEVLGTATSGQAARALGGAAGIWASRTLASTLWRVDHDQLRLSDRHMVVLDESGMTTDTDLARLLAAADAAGSKVIILGDDRQLGAVGPGGGLGALLARHPEAVWRLEENVRQRDPAEQVALAHLRAGDLDRAVGFYARHRRIVTDPDRSALIATMVERWAADTAAGKDALLVAWRRDSVAELNRAARQAWAEMGRLSGPELEAPGGVRYQAGDRIVTLTPGPEGAWVTSERAVVTSVHVRAGLLTATTDDGRAIHIAGDGLGPDRLSHSYAVTAHRSQGATSEVTHALEDGGGRELAYVKMSRARGASHLYLHADDLAQAVERLGWAWAAERRQTWAVDRGQPDRPPQATLEELYEQRRQLRARIPPDPAVDLVQARRQLERVENDWRQLHTATGRWAWTEPGQAALQLGSAQSAHQQAANLAADPELGYLARRRALRRQRAAARQLASAQQRWDQTGRSYADQIARQHHDATRAVDEHQQRVGDHQRWRALHPEVLSQLDELDNQIREQQQRQCQLEQALEHQRDLEWQRRRRNLPPGTTLDHSHHIDPGIDRGDDLGLGL